MIFLIYCIYNASVICCVEMLTSNFKRDLKCRREFDTGSLDLEIITLEARVEIIEVNKNSVLPSAPPPNNNKTNHL